MRGQEHQGLIYLEARRFPWRFRHVWFPRQDQIPQIREYARVCRKDGVTLTVRAQKALYGWSSYSLHTAQIDLTVDPFPSFKKEQRTAARKFHKDNGTICQVMTNMVWQRIDALRAQTYQRNHLDHDPTELDRLYAQRGFVRCFCALIGACKIAAGAFIFDHDNKLYLHSIADDPAYRCSNPTSALISHIAGLGHRHGYASFDLGGIDLRRPERAGINRFKLSFGGLVEYQCSSPNHTFIALKKLHDKIRGH